MSHLELRKRRWYATLTIPADLRAHFGKFKLIQSLGTSDKKVAEILAAPVVAKWKAQFLQLRGTTSPLINEALAWNRELEQKANDPFQQLIVTDHLVDRASKLKSESSNIKSEDFIAIATGERTPSNAHFEAWKAQVTGSAKTKDQRIKDVQMFIDRFPTLQDITQRKIKAWMDELAVAGKGCQRVTDSGRNYWKYLQIHDVVSPDINPFEGVLDRVRLNKTGKVGSWVPFQPNEVVTLWRKAYELKQDTQLQDLIILGAYTGARIEELCSLKLTDLTDHSFKITNSKTEAGIREVPIHSSLIPVVNRLKKESKDGYLLSELTFNKYGDRSNAIGKRFGRLKELCGFGPQQVFHSIRKTLVTLLENAGVSENVTADIVGHEKPRITYGLYSGGASMAVKREALEKVSYPIMPA